MPIWVSLGTNGIRPYFTEPRDKVWQMIPSVVQHDELMGEPNDSRTPFVMSLIPISLMADRPAASGSCGSGGGGDMQGALCNKLLTIYVTAKAG